VPINREILLDEMLFAQHVYSTQTTTMVRLSLTLILCPTPGTLTQLIDFLSAALKAAAPARRATLLPSGLRVQQGASAQQTAQARSLSAVRPLFGCRWLKLKSWLVALLPQAA